VALVRQAGFQQVDIQPWWKLFDRVWARKPGRRSPDGPVSPLGVLRCPACGQASLQVASAGALQCGQCGEFVPTSPEGIVLYAGNGAGGRGKE
jgi:hypothetical protein